MRPGTMRLSLVVTAVVVCVLASPARASSSSGMQSLTDFVNSLSPSKITETLGVAKNSIDNSCLTNSQCNKSFFTLNSYCCSLQCCDLLQYTFKNDDTTDNIKVIYKEPRPLYIIILAIVILLPLTVVICCCSMFCSCLSKCCKRTYGTPKYRSYV